MRKGKKKKKKAKNRKEKKRKGEGGETPQKNLRTSLPWLRLYLPVVLHLLYCFSNHVHGPARSREGIMITTRKKDTIRHGLVPDNVRGRKRRTKKKPHTHMVYTPQQQERTGPGQLAWASLARRWEERYGKDGGRQFAGQQDSKTGDEASSCVPSPPRNLGALLSTMLDERDCDFECSNQLLPGIVVQTEDGLMFFGAPGPLFGVGAGLCRDCEGLSAGAANKVK